MTIIKKIKHLKLILSLILMSTFLCSCIEEYWPELEASDSHSLVVEGRISSQSIPYVKLSRTSALSDSNFEPETGASVKVIDSEQNEVDLIEETPGFYNCNNQNYIGITGRSYKIRIVTADGKTYESNYEEINNPVEYGEIGYTQDEKLIDETTGTAVQGLQFHISTGEAYQQKNFLYWELEETYEYRSNDIIEWYYEGVFDPNSNGRLGTPKALPFHRTLRTCWKTNFVSEYFTKRLDTELTPTLQEFPLHFVEFGEKLRENYSLLVNQYTISQEAHTFLRALKEQNSNQSEYYSSQPYQIRGNIYNVDDPKEPVLGYFMAMGQLGSERIFAQTPPEMLVQYPLKEECSGPIHNLPGEFPRMLDHAILDTPPIMYPMYFGLFSVPFDGGVIEVQGLLPRICFDCRESGGTIVKPNYWVDYVSTY